MEKSGRINRNLSRRYASEFTRVKVLWQFWAAFCIVLPVLLIFYRIRVEGRENIPKDRKFITTANHISYFDPFLTFIATHTPTAYMAKKELFENPKMLWWLDRLGAFAVNREKLEVSTLKTVREVIKTNWSLGIFPQGGIRKHRKLGHINKGFAVISQAAKEDILPISITGCENYNWIPFKGTICIKIGKPISYELSLDEIMNEWLKQIAQMSGYDLLAIDED